MVVDPLLAVVTADDTEDSKRQVPAKRNIRFVLFEKNEPRNYTVGRAVISFGLGAPPPGRPNGFQSGILSANINFK